MVNTEQCLAVVWGKNLRAARTEAGLTQADLAEKVGVAPITISKHERGQHRPSDASKIALANALNKSVEDLFSYASPMVAS